VSQGMPGREGSRCLTRQEQVASYSRALVVTAATATTLRAAVLLRRMSLSRSRVCPGVCTKAHEGVFQGAPRGGAHTSPPMTIKSQRGLSGQNPKHAPFCMKGATTHTSLHQIGPDLALN